MLFLFFCYCWHCYCSAGHNLQHLVFVAVAVGNIRTGIRERAYVRCLVVDEERMRPRRWLESTFEFLLMLWDCWLTDTEGKGLKQESLLPQTDWAMRYVSRNLVNCCTTVGTSCPTNPQQIEVMELEHYSRWMCNKIDTSSHDVLTSTSLTIDEFCWQHDQLAVAKFSKFRVSDKVQEGTLFWGIPEFSCNTMQDRWKESTTTTTTTV